MFNEPFKDITGLLVFLALGNILYYMLQNYWMVILLMLVILMMIEFVKYFYKNKQNIFK